MDNYNKLFMIIRKTDLLFEDEKYELQLYLMNLREQVQNQKEVIDKIKKRCEIEINASNHYLKNHSSQQELCHKVAHQRILDILKEVER